MSWHTNPFVISARNVGRRLGVNSTIAAILLGSKYEESYDTAFSACIQPGDCIWDVGANVGYYTSQFVDRVGNSGSVVAFEPSRENFQVLQAKLKNATNVTLMQVAIGCEDKVVCFSQGTDELGATSRVVESSTNQVDMRSPKSIIESEKLTIPSIIKIDVEGFEYDVLMGFGNLLLNSKIRAIGVEVHFNLLNERGMPDGPARIEKLLVKSGFKVKWVDPSHLLATR